MATSGGEATDIDEICWVSGMVLGPALSPLRAGPCGFEAAQGRRATRGALPEPSEGLKSS